MATTQTITHVFTDTAANLNDMLVNYTDSKGYQTTINGVANPESRLVFAERVSKQGMIDEAMRWKLEAATRAASAAVPPYTIT